DEVEQVPARRLGLVAEELSDGAGEAWHEFAMTAAGDAVVGSLDNLLGGEALLSGGCGATEAEQPGDGRDLQAGLGVQQEMAEQAPGEIIVTALLEKLPGRLQDSALRVGQCLLGNEAVLEPTGKGQPVDRHRGLSLAEGDTDSL